MLCTCHIHYPDNMKVFIISEISKSEQVIRVLPATVAHGIGLHAPVEHKLYTFKILPALKSTYNKMAAREKMDYQWV